MYQNRIYNSFISHFSLFLCGTVHLKLTTWLLTHGASRTHIILCRTVLLTRTEQATQRNWNIYIRKSMHVMPFTWKSVFFMYFHRWQLCIRKFAVWRPC